MRMEDLFPMTNLKKMNSFNYFVMKTNLILLVFMVLACQLHAQSDSSRNLSIKKQPGVISEDSQQTRFRKEMVRVDTDNLPESVKQALASDTIYKGWEGRTFYYDPATGIFVMVVKDGITTRLIRFDKNGKAVSGNIPDQPD